MKNFYLTLLFVVLICSNMSHAQEAPVQAPDSGKKELIMKFIDVFGTREAMTQNLEEMLKTMPEDSADAKKFREGIKVDEIIERLVPVYDKQFSESELKAFIAFYSSEDGQKLVKGIPVIMQESVDVSTKYFQEKFPEMEEPKDANEEPVAPTAVTP